ncbi:MAG: hypothetical protein ACI82S_003205, partial [Patiriisocius sp.]
KIGVFASRSSFRPNGIGMSVVKNLGVKNNKLMVEGVDLLSNTPILDIKPYLPYADIVQHASAGYAQDKPLPTLDLIYSQQAADQLALYQSQYPDFADLLQSILAQDPRPSYKQTKPDAKVYFVQLYDIEVRWLVNHNAVEVIDIYRMQK